MLQESRHDPVHKLQEDPARRHGELGALLRAFRDVLRQPEGGEHECRKPHSIVIRRSCCLHLLMSDCSPRECATHMKKSKGAKDQPSISMGAPENTTAKAAQAMNAKENANCSKLPDLYMPKGNIPRLTCLWMT